MVYLLTSKVVQMKSNHSSVQSSRSVATKGHVIVIHQKIIDITKVVLAKRFQPLKGPLESYEPKDQAKMGVGLRGVDGPLAFWATVDPDKQAQILQEIRAALAEVGLLDNYQLIPDGTFFLPHMVQAGGSALYPNGWVVQLFGASPAKPILTCLLESEAVCEQVLHDVAARLNTANA